MRSVLKNSLITLIILVLTACSARKDDEQAIPEHWQPVSGSSWHFQLQGELVKYDDAGVYDIDLFNTDESMIELLHSEGKRVICYFSAGSFEDWRPDSGSFPPELTGKPHPKWESKKWLDIREIGKLAPMIEARLDLAVAKGCDAVDADNVDAYSYDSGFDITYEDQIRFNNYLADEAHKRGLAIGLKNNFGQVKDLADVFDFAVSEQCFELNQCDLLYPFIKKGKAVFGVEYAFPAEVFCDAANNVGYDFILSNRELDGTFRIPCR